MKIRKKYKAKTRTYIDVEKQMQTTDILYNRLIVRVHAR